LEHGVLQKTSPRKRRKETLSAEAFFLTAVLKIVPEDVFRKTQEAPLLLKPLMDDLSMRTQASTRAPP
jgi:hypothetical protein